MEMLSKTPQEGAAALGRTFFALPQSIRSAAKTQTFLHHNYFGDENFAARVYAAQIGAMSATLAIIKKRGV